LNTQSSNARRAGTWYGQRSSANESNKSQRFSELTLLLDELIAEQKENAKKRPYGYSYGIDGFQRVGRQLGLSLTLSITIGCAKMASR
jgi:hypothetical protein